MIRGVSRSQAAEFPPAVPVTSLAGRPETTNAPKPPTTPLKPNSRRKAAPELATTSSKRLLPPRTGYNGNFIMFPLLRLARHLPRSPLRPFTTSAVLPKNKPSKQNLPARPTPPPEDDIEEAFIKGSGPGGQKIVPFPPPPRHPPSPSALTNKQPKHLQNPPFLYPNPQGAKR